MVAASHKENKMLFVTEIPKNASRFLDLTARAVLQRGQKKYIYAVAVREPFSRFWSAVKTMTPSISYYGSYPPSGTSIITSYTDAEITIDYAQVIEDALKTLGSSTMDVHLETQSSYVVGKKYDVVWRVDSTLLDQVKSTVTNNNIVFNEAYDIDRYAIHYLNASPHDKDTEAMSYIMETPSVKEQIERFYAEDFVLWNDTSSLI